MLVGQKGRGVTKEREWGPNECDEGLCRSLKRREKGTRSWKKNLPETLFLTKRGLSTQCRLKREEGQKWEVKDGGEGERGR